MTMLDKEADEYFRTRPEDIEPDDEVNELLDRFESKHLTDQQRKLIDQPSDEQYHR